MKNEKKAVVQKIEAAEKMVSKNETATVVAEKNETAAVPVAAEKPPVEKPVVAEKPKNATPAVPPKNHPQKDQAQKVEKAASTFDQEIRQQEQKLKELEK